MFKKLAITFVLGCLFVPFVSATECHESIITTDATINREVAPDTAKIRFMVDNSGLNLTAIKEKNDKIVNDAIVAIKTLLNQDESIKTIAFNVRNIYTYKDKVRVFQKYVVSNGFEVKLKDLDKVSKVINLAMEKGVKNVTGINFIIEDSESVCNQMMADAIKMGKKRISHLSNAAGTSLDKAKSINPYCSLSASHTQPRFNKTYVNSASDSIGSEAQNLETIEPGTINVRASVNMIYYLK